MATGAKEITQLNEATSVTTEDKLVLAQEGATEAVQASVAKLAAPVAETLSTGALAELEYATSQGKNAIATALTNKGVETTASETLIQMADKITNYDINNRYIKGTLSSSYAAAATSSDIIFGEDCLVYMPVSHTMVILYNKTIYVVPTENYTSHGDMIAAATCSYDCSAYASNYTRINISKDESKIFYMYQYNSSDTYPDYKGLVLNVNSDKTSITLGTEVTIPSLNGRQTSMSQYKMPHGFIGLEQNDLYFHIENGSYEGFTNYIYTFFKSNGDVVKRIRCTKNVSLGSYSKSNNMLFTTNNKLYMKLSDNIYAFVEYSFTNDTNIAIIAENFYTDTGTKFPSLHLTSTDYPYFVYNSDIDKVLLLTCSRTSDISQTKLYYGNVNKSYTYYLGSIGILDISYTTALTTQVPILIPDSITNYAEQYFTFCTSLLKFSYDSEFLSVHIPTKLMPSGGFKYKYSNASVLWNGGIPEVYYISGKSAQGSSPSKASCIGIVNGQAYTKSHNSSTVFKQDIRENQKIIIVYDTLEHGPVGYLYLFYNVPNNISTGGIDANIQITPAAPDEPADDPSGGATNKEHKLVYVPHMDSYKDIWDFGIDSVYVKELPSEIGQMVPAYSDKDCKQRVTISGDYMAVTLADNVITTRIDNTNYVANYKWAFRASESDSVTQGWGFVDVDGQKRPETPYYAIKLGNNLNGAGLIPEGYQYLYTKKEPVVVADGYTVAELYLDPSCTKVAYDMRDNIPLVLYTDGTIFGYTYAYSSAEDSYWKLMKVNSEGQLMEISGLPSGSDPWNIAYVGAVYVSNKETFYAKDKKEGAQLYSDINYKYPIDGSGYTPMGDVACYGYVAKSPDEVQMVREADGKSYTFRYEIEYRPQDPSDNREFTITYVRLALLEE